MYQLTKNKLKKVNNMTDLGWQDINPIQFFSAYLLPIDKLYQKSSDSPSAFLPQIKIYVII